MMVRRAPTSQGFRVSLSCTAVRAGADLDGIPEHLCHTAAWGLFFLFLPQRSRSLLEIDGLPAAVVALGEGSMEKSV